MSSGVVIVEYDPCWSQLFEQLRDRVTAALGDLAVAVEHVGSTAVPGLSAKPIIDLDTVISSTADLPTAITRLATHGYVYEGDLGIPGREAFRPPPGLPYHHLYVVTPDSAEYRRHLLFRDYLRAHPESAQAYGELKRVVAQQAGIDRVGYSRAKDGFVTLVLRRAASQGVRFPAPVMAACPECSQHSVTPPDAPKVLHL